MLSITKYLFEQDNVPVPQTVLDARANSLAAVRARLAAGQKSLAPQPTVARVISRANEPQPAAGAAKMIAPHAIEAPRPVDASTWGKLATKTVQSVTN